MAMISSCVYCPLVVILIAIFAIRLMTHEEIRCPPGEYAKGDTCEPCPSEMFMSEENHQHKDCWNCTYPKPGSHERVLQECTPIANSIIGCENGYYRQGRKCKACTDCASKDQFEIQKCGHNTDTVCCPESNMNVETEADGSRKCMKHQAHINNKISIKCRKGHFLSFSDLEIPSCVPCVDGTFMTDDFHSNRMCRKCTEVMEGAHETVVESCTTIEDAVIACERGYYRYHKHSEPKGGCLQCSTCGPEQPHEKQPCGTNSDTVCCPDVDMDVEEDHEGVFKCVPKLKSSNKIMVSCGAGQYLEYDKSGIAHCRSCKNNTFMPIGNHVNTACKPCTKANALLKEVEIAKCTPTKDAVIVCKQGYFLNDQGNEITSDSLERRHIYSGCDRCSVCKYNLLNKYEVRQCTHNTDTVCCPEPGMTVISDDHGKVQCTSSTSLAEVIFHCGKGHFLKYNSANKPSCKQCPDDTFMPIGNHNQTKCISCTHADKYLMEKEVKPCTTTSDTVILCTDGHYREEVEDTFMSSGTCSICKDCQFEPKDKYFGRKCEGYTDTVCCPEKDMEVEMDKDGKFVCMFPPEFDSKPRHKSTISDSMDHKRNVSCFPGEYPVVRISKTDYVICRDCPPQLRETDTVLIASFCVNNSKGGDVSPQNGLLKAIQRPEKCLAGEHVYELHLIAGEHVYELHLIAEDKNEVLCIKCANGTYMNEKSHTRTKCTPCTTDIRKTVKENCTRISDTQFVESVASSSSKSQYTFVIMYCLIVILRNICFCMRIQS